MLSRYLWILSGYYIKGCTYAVIWYIINGNSRAISKLYKIAQIMSQYRYILIDEFGGACRKFVSRLEAAPYLTSGMRLEALPKIPKTNPYTMASSLLKEALF